MKIHTVNEDDMTVTEAQFLGLMEDAVNNELRERIADFGVLELRDYLYRAVNYIYTHGDSGESEGCHATLKKANQTIQERCAELDDLIAERDKLQAALDERDATLTDLRNQVQQLQQANKRMALAFGAIDSTIQGLKL